MDCSNFREYKFFTVEQWGNENLNIHFILFRLITKFYFVKKKGEGKHLNFPRHFYSQQSIHYAFKCKKKIYHRFLIELDCISMYH